MWILICLWYWSRLSMAPAQVFSRQHYGMKNTSLVGVIIPSISLDTTVGVPSAVQCQALCMQSITCLSFFYNTNSKLCQRNTAVFEGADDSITLPGTNYFTFTSQVLISRTTLGHFIHHGLGLEIWPVPQSMVWASADDFCQREGGQLVSLDSMAKFEFLIDVIKSNGDNQGDIFHIGLSDAVEEGTWVWGNGKSMDIESPMWCKDQPDDGIILLSQDQAAMCNTKECPFQLDDIWENQQGHPVCELPYQ